MVNPISSTPEFTIDEYIFPIFDGGFLLGFYAQLRRGALVEPMDTYGMTPLHRMASNNLPVGVGHLVISNFEGERGANF